MVLDTLNRNLLHIAVSNNNSEAIAILLKDAELDLFVLLFQLDNRNRLPIDLAWKTDTEIKKLLRPRYLVFVSPMLDQLKASKKLLSRDLILLILNYAY